jgi:hypothetical protein
MSNISLSNYELLKTKLRNEFLTYVHIQDDTKTPTQLESKNLTRAFSAFVLQQLCGISAELAAKAVIDDFDDRGIDAIYFNTSNETLYLIQTKLKESEQFMLII